MHELGGRRSGYQSPEVVLAEARRLADEIRRRAERDAATIRRDAASWASATRAEAAEMRDAVLAELSAQRALPAAPAPHRSPVPYADVPPPPPPPPPPPRPARVPASSDERVLSGEVIDLRAEAAARRGHPGFDHRVGEVIEVNLESKLYDVVVLALRRTFEEPAG